MGNFEKLSVLVIVVIIVMILVVALYTWTEDPNAGSATATAEKNEQAAAPAAPGSGTNKSPTKVEFPDVAPRLPSSGGMSGNGTPLAGGAPSKDETKPVSPFASLFDKPLAGTPGPGGDGNGLPATPPADPASAKPVEPRLHVVAAGETIAKIAKIEYPSVGQRAIDAILKANPTIDPNRLRIGEKVVLPELALASPGGAPGTPGVAVVKPPAPAAELRPGTVYVVRQGDTLPGISKRAYSSPGRWQDIWIENFGAIEDPDHLHAGTRLKLPK